MSSVPAGQTGERIEPEQHPVLPASLPQNQGTRRNQRGASAVPRRSSRLHRPASLPITARICRDLRPAVTYRGAWRSCCWLRPTRPWTAPAAFYSSSGLTWKAGEEGEELSRRCRVYGRREAAAAVSRAMGHGARAGVESARVRRSKDWSDAGEEGQEARTARRAGERHRRWSGSATAGRDESQPVRGTPAMPPPCSLRNRRAPWTRLPVVISRAGLCALRSTHEAVMGSKPPLDSSLVVSVVPLKLPRPELRTPQRLPRREEEEPLPRAASLPCLRRSMEQPCLWAVAAACGDPGQPTALASTDQKLFLSS